MQNGAPKPRRRIVAQLVVSPTGAERPLEPSEERQEEVRPVAAAQQREQSEWAKQNLGPERKVFVDLTDASNQELDWKKILKERGVQKPSKAAAAQPIDPAAGNDALLQRGRTGRQENTWTKMLAKLEATYCVGAQSEEESESDGWGEEGSDSDAEEEGEGGKAGGKEGSEGEGGEGGEGHTTGGEGGGGGSKKGEGPGKRKKKEEGYDYFDDFIDDEEFIELLQHDKRKPKHTGFFISKGEIERTDEMLPGYEELAGKKGGKRKAEGEDGAAEAGGAPAAKEAKANGAAAAGEKKKRKAAAEGAEGGGASGAEGDKPPAKKKKKIVAEPVGAPAGAAGAAGAAQPTEAAAAQPTGLPTKPAVLSIAEQARMAGQMAAAGVPMLAGAPTAPPAAGGAASQASSPLPSQQPSSQQPSSQAPPPSAAKKRAPYEMPAAVLGAIADIKRLVAQQVVPPAPAPGEKARRSLPKVLAAAIDAFSPLFLQQEDAGGRAATNRILDELGALEPFISKASLSSRLRQARKQAQEKQPAEAGPKLVSGEQLRALIVAKVQAKPVTSDDDFETAPPPRPSTSPPGAAAGGEAGAGPSASQAAGSQAGPAAPAKWKSVDKVVQQQVYLYFKERLGDHPFHSQPGKILQQEVFNWFPLNSIDRTDLHSIYKAGKAREKAKEKRAEAAAAAAAMAAAGQAMIGEPVAAGTPAAPAAAVPQQQQQQPPQQQQPQQQQQPPQQQQQQQPAGSLSVAEAFAAAAMAAAAEKLASPGPSPAAAAQPATAASPSVQQAAAPAAGQGGIAAAAAAAGAAAAAAAAAQPAAGAGAAAPAAGAAAQPPLTPAKKRTEDDCVAKSIQLWGAAEPAMRQALADGKSGMYTSALAKVLMIVGPSGTTSAASARQAVEFGVAEWDYNAPAVKSGMSKATRDLREHVCYVGNNKYALKAIPGVDEQPRPVRVVKRSGKASGGTQGSPGEGGSVVADQKAAAHEEEGEEEEEAEEEAAAAEQQQQQQGGAVATEAA